jgi:hypothetical protein
MSWSGLCNNLTSFDAGALINPTIFPLISSREGKVATFAISSFE